MWNTATFVGLHFLHSFPTDLWRKCFHLHFNAFTETAQILFEKKNVNRLYGTDSFQKKKKHVAKLHEWVKAGGCCRAAISKLTGCLNHYMHFLNYKSTNMLLHFKENTNRLSLPGPDMLKTDLWFSEPTSVSKHQDHYVGEENVGKLWCVQYKRWKQAEQVQKNKSSAWN